MTQVQVNDGSSFELQKLKLVVAIEQEDNNSSRNRTKNFKVIGKGGFGSIYQGTIPKEHTDVITGIAYFKGVKRVGRFHGVVLEKAEECCPSQASDGIEPVEEIMMVAVKQVNLSPDLSREDLDREARNLRHFWGCRNFAAVYGLTYCKQLESVCIVMEMVPGCNLNQFLRSRGTAIFDDPAASTANIGSLWSSNEVLWWIQKLTLFREIVLALMLCHRKKVYHGDLKGDNILLGEQLIPKLIDFGLSFQKRDVTYLRHMGGSLFWVAPEVIEQQDKPPSVVLADPFPSDVYSLGMVLLEILLDGEIPDSFTDDNFVIMDKAQGYYPVSLDDVQSDDPFLSQSVIEPLKDLVDECCKLEREDRISLQSCLSLVEKVHSGLFARYRDSTAGHPSSVCERDEDLFIASKGYREMLRTFKERLPDVLVLNPSQNMVISEDGTLLVHCFCKLDFVEGVEYIVEKSTWDFQAERDIPHMSLLCVENDSLSTLKYIAASWRDVLRRQLLLIHVACNSSNLDVFKLLLDIRMDFDTWIAEGPYIIRMKPIHKLAANGKTEWLRCLLDHPRVDVTYINTSTMFYGASRLLPDDSIPIDVPLYHAVVQDRMDTVKFILGRLTDEIRSRWFDNLLGLAMENYSIGVLLEFDYTLEKCGVPPSSEILRRHVDDVALTSPRRKPIHLACQKGKEDVFKAAFDICNIPIPPDVKFYIAKDGSKEMIDIILEKPFSTFHNVNGIFERRDIDMFLLDHKSASISLFEQFYSDTGHITFPDVAAASGNTEVLQHFIKLQVEASRSRDTFFQESGDVSIHPSSSTTSRCSDKCEVLAHLETEVISMHFALDNPNDLAMDCCRKGHVGILKFLKDSCGLDLDAIRDKEGVDSLLHSAAHRGHTDMVMYLLERGFSVDNTIHFMRQQPLRAACDRGRYSDGEGTPVSWRITKDTAALLLEKGANPNYVDQGGYTAMDGAIGWKDKEIVRLLVDHGFDVGKKDRWGEEYFTQVANM